MALHTDTRFSISLTSPAFLAGFVIVAVAALVPSQGWIDVLNPSAGSDLKAALLTGTTLFRLGLGLFGAMLVFEPWLRRLIPPAKDSGERLPWTLTEVTGLSLLAAVSIWIRLPSLDSGLWLDEILTHVNYATLPVGELLTTYASENQHTLYSLLAHLSLNIFGDSALALRLPAVLFGVLSVVALYLLGRELGGRAEAFLAAGLMGFTYHHVWFSQNARGYSGLLFWAILSSWFLIRALKNSKPRDWALYAGCAALGLYTHLTMIFVIVGQVAAWLWSVRPASRDWARRLPSGAVYGFGLGALLSYLLYSMVLPQIVGSIDETESVVAAWREPIWALLELAKGLQVTFASWLVVIPALGLFTLGLLSYARSSPEFAIVFLLPPILGAAVVILMGHHIWPRFFYFAFGFAALIVVRGTLRFTGLTLSAFGLGERLRGYVGKGICVGLILLSASSIPLAYGPKQDYQAAIDFIDQVRSPQDAVVTVGLASFPYRDYYRVNWQAVETLEELRQVRTSSPNTWLVYTLEPVMASVNPDILRAIRAEFTFVREFPGTLQNGSVFVYQASGETSAGSFNGSVRR